MKKIENQKDKINRKDLKTNDLKRLIIRLDFVGVMDIERVIECLRESLFVKYFKSYVRSPKRNIDVTDMAEVANLLKVRLSDYSSSIIHRFYNTSSFGDNQVSIEVSNYALLLDAQCTRYQGFEAYRDFLLSLFDEIRKIETYLNVKRIGISKTCIFWSEHQRNIRKWVTTEALPDPVVIETYPECRYEDKFLWRSYRLRALLVRELKWGTLKLRENEELKHILQISLNYSLTKHITNDEEQHVNSADGLKCLLDQINDAHFDLFKQSVTIDYINKHRNG